MTATDFNCVTPAAERRSRHAFNRALQKLTVNCYFDAIPVTLLDEQLRLHGFSFLQDGIYCGADGQINEQVGPNTWLAMSWHRMESGRYEIVVYVS